MATQRSGRARLVDCLERNGWAAVGEDEFQYLLAEFAPMAERRLRGLLRDSGVPLSPLVEGVRQQSLEDLERTLRMLQEEYAEADIPRRRRIRRLIIEGRDHARLAAKRMAAPALKREAILWMDTWLENPEAFSLWVVLRKQAL